MKKILFALFTLLIIHTVNAQKDTLKEGRFTISFTDPNPTAMVKSPAEYVAYVKNDNVRTEVKTETENIVVISLAKENQMYFLMEMLGKKFAIKMDTAEANALAKEQHKDFQPKVKKTKETKQILGYTCYKAILKVKDEDGKKHAFDCWYAPDFYVPQSALAMNEAMGISGFIFEITMMQQGLTMKMNVTSIDKLPVADSLFIVPSDYALKTSQEMQQEMMSGFDNPAPEDTAAPLSQPGSTPGPLSIGSVIPDIELNNVQGNPVKLSSLRGQYVLVDFWASWCGPCRMENPAVVAAYKKYKDKGFTIYSISLDSDKEKWVKAIEKDKLEWNTHVSDFKGWYSPVCQQFNIQAIPANFLIDGEGKIIATDLRGDELEKALDKYMK